MPIGIGNHGRAGFIQSLDLLGAQRKAGSSQVVTQLVFIASSNDYAGDSGFAQQPVQRNLRNRLASFGGYDVERVHYFV